ncbi:hypothetical protein AsFcp4_215 [Aeromonas phage AsFcp_4]|uniref:Uncharacterized protein n=1 Tax=Aeromonas phage PX29 TaxID=926067 RepID=E5DPZ0_9CAUD|nr:hypothetical protein CL89_gp057 [Aeromonas phage PX29]ADQ52776.1 conserved hypothetical protein [Aeromonas phage PX29]QAX98636.1 hypothetical protein ASfcp2_303 [Aeromonas phage AsFcp_2]QAX99668.1 hypothetical protein AsFcp4_215 [Aeromonas phage AsFcp_4]
MKGQNRIFHWKHHTINLTELDQKINWHLKMQSSVGFSEFDYFLESLRRHMIAGGEDVVSYANARGFEQQLMEFVK